MAKTTENGWPVITSGLATITAGGRSCRTRSGSVAVVMQWVADQYQARVEKVVSFTGYRTAAVNAASGGIASSNHLSGTAVDINGAVYPYEYTHRKTWRSQFSGARLAAVRSILADAGGVLRWGGDFASPRRDEMHWEIRPGTSAARVDALAARIKCAAATAGSPPPREEDIMASLADLERAVDARMKRPWYKIAGTDLGWEDLGTARRAGSLQRYEAMGSPPIAVLDMDDAFWRLPVVGDPLYREAYRPAGSPDVWYLDVVEGALCRVWADPDRYAAAGKPLPKDLPVDHPVWSLPVRSDVQPEGA